MGVLHVRCSGGWEQSCEMMETVKAVFEKYKQAGSSMYLNNRIVVNLVFNHNGSPDRVDLQAIADELRTFPKLHVIVSD